MRESARRRRLFAHPPRRWWLAFEAACTLTWLKLLIWLRPFRRYRHRLAPRETSPKRILSALEVADLVWAVDAVARVAPRRFDCLPQALAIQTMLRRRGGDCGVRLGVAASTDGGFRAHAWVEYEQVVIVGALPDLQSYAPFESWPQR